MALERELVDDDLVEADRTLSEYPSPATPGLRTALSDLRCRPQETKENGGDARNARKAGVQEEGRRTLRSALCAVSRLWQPDGYQFSEQTYHYIAGLVQELATS